jgi:hypothetical protein
MIDLKETMAKFGDQSSAIGTIICHENTADRIGIPKRSRLNIGGGLVQVEKEGGVIRPATINKSEFGPLKNDPIEFEWGDVDDTPDFMHVIGYIPCVTWAGDLPIFEEEDPVTLKKWKQAIRILEVSNITGVGTSRVVFKRVFSRKSKKAYKNKMAREYGRLLARDPEFVKGLYGSGE